MKKKMVKKSFDFWRVDFPVTIQNEYAELSPNFNTYYKMVKMNADLYRCIDEICQTSMKCGYKFYKIANDQPKEYESEEIQAVFSSQWESSLSELVKQMLRSYLITGNIFVYKRQNAFGIMGYRVIDPRTVKITYDEVTNTVLKYQYRMNHQDYTVLPEYMFHFANWVDLEKKPFWISALTTIIIDVFSNYQSSVANYSYFKNDILPSHIAMIDDDYPDEEKERIMEYMRNTLSWGTGKHKLVALSGLKEIKPIEKRHTDMEFTEQNRYTTEKICSAMWVPKIILWYTDSVNYSNAETQYEKFIENTIRPVEKCIETWINKMVSEIEEWVYFQIFDDHQNKFAKWVTIYSEAVKNGIITQNEARNMLGLDPILREEYNLLQSGLKNTAKEW